MKSYRNAAIEYERVIYLKNEHLTTNHAVFRKALCYKGLGDYGRACLQMERVSYYATSDSAQFLYHYETALCSYLAGKFEDAESQLIQIKHYTKDTTLLKKIYLLEVLNYNELIDYNNARESLSKYFKTNYSSGKSDSLERIFAEYYVKSGLPEFKNQKTGSRLEYFPGMGLFYAGYPVLGTFNFLLNAACLAGGIYEIYYGFYFTGYFTGAALLSKFYYGGWNLTNNKINAHNYKVKRDFNDRIRMSLQKIADN
jgi:tetratricopeptide (TPR) repeat protein